MIDYEGSSNYLGWSHFADWWGEWVACIKERDEAKNRLYIALWICVCGRRRGRVATFRHPYLDRNVVLDTSVSYWQCAEEKYEHWATITCKMVHLNFTKGPLGAR